MTPDMVRKVIRFVVIGVIFTSMLVLQGVAEREAQQVIFMLAMVSLVSLIVQNVWVTLFILWTVFLYSFFKFDCGGTYLSNVFLGSILYYITKLGFKREHINLFLSGFLWFVFFNIAYMAIQACGYDFIYMQRIVHLNGLIKYVNPTNINGFMGHQSILGCLMALAVPILATRRTRTAWVGSVGLFVPLYLCHTSLCLLMGLIGLLFVLFYRIPRRIWVVGVVVLSLCGGVYMNKVDGFGMERTKLWKVAMKDAMIHPITGWGLDSFANVTKQKDFRYTNTMNNFPNRHFKGGVTNIQYWDNPHNLYVSLFYEFGVIGLLLFIGFMRKNILRFAYAVKSPNTIGLAGFILVFCGLSAGHFPMWLARMTVFIIPCFTLFETETS